MKLLALLTLTSLSSAVWAVHYDRHEITQLSLNSGLSQLSTDYQKAYFTAADPASVVDQIMAADLIPLHKEAILHQLLTAVSQQPPQAAHQYLVDVMKTYPTQATMDHEEGRLPTAVFNLNSKAHGIENIWLSYRSEQQYHRLLSSQPAQALNTFREVIASGNRPQWLAIKNSLAATDPKSRARMVDLLLNKVALGEGLDPLISHLGLTTGHQGLIEKALQSKQQQVREMTLRSVPRYFDDTFSRELLLKQASQGPDQVFSTTLLAAHVNTPAVEQFLMNSLGHAKTAGAAAFALSQSTDPGLPDRLYEVHQKSSSQTTRNHILMTLRLQRTELAESLARTLEQQAMRTSGGES